MSPRKQPIGFEISTSARDDGTIEAVYIYFARKTREIEGDALLADFDAQGNIIGFEILAPVKFSDILDLVEPPRRAPFERFVRQAAPPSLVHA